MYRQGLGDCFLLAFAGEDPLKPTYVLVDCGVHMRQQNGTARLAQVMKNIKEATGGKLDVVVATHAHADHLSGFVQKGSPFTTAEIEVGQFWVAWTERVGDRQADILSRRRGAARDAIQRAADRLDQLTRKAGEVSTHENSRAARLLGFMDFETMAPEALGLGDGAAAAPNVMDRRPSSNEVALEFLGRHSDRIVYCEPGDIVPIPGVSSARAYVLGPPRQEDLLKRDLPRSGPSQETYLTGRSEQQTFMLAPGLDGGGFVVGISTMPENLRYPFDREVGREYAYNPETGAVEWGPFEDVPEATRAIGAIYSAAGGDWRQIEADWLNAAEDLALNLDSDTNNTSLVLAFELGPIGAGDVLLFVGDAQVGNWLSWRGQTFETGRVRQSADDLLRRTILYKVGHHGSHNATVKLDPGDTSPRYPHGVPFGLELMPSRLIAMVPVDRDAAQRPMPKSWDMPHAPLYKRLIEKTAGRVLRSDGQVPAPEVNVGDMNVVIPRGSTPEPVPGVRNGHWRESEATFDDGPRHPLYYEIVFII
jgi:hypothetical protein